MAWETWLRSLLIWLCCSFISMNHSQRRSLNCRVFSNQCFCATSYLWMGLKHDFFWQDVRTINPLFRILKISQAYRHPSVPQGQHCSDRVVVTMGKSRYTQTNSFCTCSLGILSSTASYNITFCSTAAELPARKGRNGFISVTCHYWSTASRLSCWEPLCQRGAKSGDNILTFFLTRICFLLSKERDSFKVIWPAQDWQ